MPQIRERSTDHWQYGIGSRRVGRAIMRRHGPPSSRVALRTPALLLAAALAGCSLGAVSPDPAPGRVTGAIETPDGARIYYERLGADPAAEKPAVIFVHGLGGNHAVWYRQVPFFAARFDTVTYSQRGFAPSSAAGESFDLPVLVADLEALMDDLGIERAHLVGQSMGGWTALGLALEKPARIRSVVLADTLAGIFDEEIEAHYEAMVASARELGRRPPRLSRHPALDPAFSAAEPAEGYLYQTLSAFGAPAPGEIAGRLARARFEHARLGSNRVPTLFVVGERDKIFPPPMVRRASGYLAASRLAIIEDAGHSPYYERPEAWRRAVFEFLSPLR